jgi:hypothetical protein
MTYITGRRCKYISHTILGNHVFFSNAFEIRQIRTNTFQETLVRQEYQLNISHNENAVPQKNILRRSKFVLLK